MKKTVILLILVLITFTGVSAQNIFFATKQGMILEYANLNNKGKVDTYTRLTIQDVEGTGNNLTINYLSSVLDKNRKPSKTIDIPYSVSIVNGTVELDMKMYAAPETASFLTMEGDNIRIPSTLSPGDKLEDVNFILTVNMVIRIRTEIAITDHECLSIEEITVPAGTFNCYKVTQTSAATVLRKTVTTKTITWYAPGIGSVKSENYNEKGQLQNSTVLESVEN